MSTRKQLLNAVAIALLLLAAISASAATLAERRIHFARGRTSTVVRGVWSANGKDGDFVLHARSGQKLVLNLSAPGDTIFILTSPTNVNMAGEGGKGRAEFDLTETGDYHISITNRDGKRTRFRLAVTVR